MRLRILCPAKVNLFLAVGPPDIVGYHPLRTVFQAVGLYDELLLESLGPPSPHAQPVWHLPEGLPPENTLTKAWRLMAEVATLPPVRTTLTKAIPSEAGLGGGSSDAAGLIRGLSALLPQPPPTYELANVAAAIGADVPFFLHGGRARGEGYGEILTPLPDPSPIPVLLAKPPEGCSTAEMYRALDDQPREWRPFPSDDGLYNDFERVAPCVCLELAERMRVHGADAAGLSGSGSAVFGIFSQESDAQRAADLLTQEFPGLWTAVAAMLGGEASRRIERLG